MTKTEMVSPDQASSLQQAVNTISERLDNVTVQVTQDYSSRIQQLNASLSESTTALETFLLNVLVDQNHPVTSCSALPLSFPSGYYWVSNSNGSAVRVYCDMARSCDGVTGGWLRVAELDMTNSSHQCPSGLRQRTEPNLRTCVRDPSAAGCSSVMFSTSSINYMSVCGRVITYQYGSTDAFNGGLIDVIYVDGVSLTHGSPKEHI